MIKLDEYHELSQRAFDGKWVLWQKRIPVASEYKVVASCQQDGYPYCFEWIPIRVFDYLVEVK